MRTIQDSTSSSPNSAPGSARGSAHDDGPNSEHTQTIRVRRRTPAGGTSATSSETRISNRQDPELRIEYLPIADVKPAPVELRKHSKAQIAAMMASLRIFGLNGPILVGPDNVVIDGHAILEAAAALGHKTVPVLHLDHLNARQRRAYRIAVNKLGEQTVWNEEALRLELIELVPILISEEIEPEAIGLSMTAVDLILAGDIEPEAGEDAEERVEPPAVTRLGDVWALGEHRLICGDCLDADTLVRLMQGARARMVFTDPPYNLKVDGGISGLGKVKHREFAMASGEMSEAEFLAFLTLYNTNLRAHCVDGAIGYHAMDGKHVHLLIAAVQAAGAEYKQLCVWNKNNAGMGTFYRSKHELFVVTKSGKAPHINNFGLGDTGRYRASVWGNYSPPCQRSESLNRWGHGSR